MGCGHCFWAFSHLFTLVLEIWLLPSVQVNIHIFLYWRQNLIDFAHVCSLLLNTLLVPDLIKIGFASMAVIVRFTLSLDSFQKADSPWLTISVFSCCIQSFLTAECREKFPYDKLFQIAWSMHEWEKTYYSPWDSLHNRRSLPLDLPTGQLPYLT